MNDPFIWIALICGLLGGFFAANNHALLDFSRSKLDDLLEDKGKEHLAKSLDLRDGLIEMTAFFRSLLNLIVVLAMVAYFLADKAAAPAELTSSEFWWELLFSFIGAGAIILIFGVVIPQSLARYTPESLLVHSLPTLAMMNKLFWPIHWLVRPFAPVIRRLLGVSITKEDERTALEQEILDVVSEAEVTGQFDETQMEMIEAVVDFSSTIVEQIMTPRIDVKGIETDQSLDSVVQFINEHGHTRYPVYEGDLDHIVGILYAKDLLQFINMKSEQPFDLKSVLRESLFVPETKPLNDLLKEFQSRKVHLALVLDEYGGTAGLVSIEDIVEEIVGEIQDEYDTNEKPEPIIEKLDAQTFLIEGRVYIDDLNDELDIELPEKEDYDTVGGFVFSTLGHIPDVGEIFQFENLQFTVTQAEKTKVNQVKIERLKPQNGDKNNT